MKTTLMTLLLTVAIAATATAGDLSFWNDVDEGYALHPISTFEADVYDQDACNKQAQVQHKVDVSLSAAQYDVSITAPVCDHSRGQEVAVSDNLRYTWSLTQADF